MILHRMRLTNFRGIADRDVSFPESGVVVVCGPNEVGKSSMLEALDLLLEHKDRSAKQKVVQVRPTHTDAGSEVEAEISTGPYRFVYRKRFHRRPVTELTVITPVREQLTGDEAHDKVKAILAETVDTRLWEAQRVLQASATEAVNLSDCDALARALDAAAGEVDAPGGSDALLIDRIDAEFARYFTTTGRPTREWRTALDRVDAAERAAQQCREAVVEVEDEVRCHEELTAARARLTDEQGPVQARLVTAEAAHTALTALQARVEQARLAATAAEGTHRAAAAAHEKRYGVANAVTARAAALADIGRQLTEAEATESEAGSAADTAAAGSATAAAALVAAQERLEAATAAARACTDREDVAHLAQRLGLIEAAESELLRVAGQLAGITLTADHLSEIETTHALVEGLEARLRADAATVEFTAAAELAITVDGTPLTLAAGETWTPPGPEAVTVALPGLLTVRIDPGATAAELYAELADARRRRDVALAAAGMADRQAARDAERHRIDLEHAHLEAAAGLKGLCAGDEVDRLRARLAELTAALADTVGEVEPAAAAEELRAAAEALREARATASAAAEVAEAAAAAKAAAATAAAVLRQSLDAAGRELQAVTDQLEALQAEASDADVAAAAAEAEGNWRAAEQTLVSLTDEYQAADPEGVAAEFAAAARAAADLAARRDDADRALATIAARLEVMGNEGRQGRLDDAETELRHARAEHDRIGERAEAVQLLRDTMTRHRDNTRRRYVQPYRAELERLGRIVFGDTFEVEVDSTLTIRTRTLKGCTVPYESLSGGAKEQLGILARLAGAALVADEDTVPVVIDDALGFSDDERLENMGKVFSTVGDSGQVIVLTCQRDRYAGIADATVIELSA